MEIGILILIILGSFIFKKGKSNGESPQKTVPSKDMTWEEMEEYYGITLSRHSEEPEVPEVSVQVPADVTMRNTSESTVSTGNPMDANMYEKPVYSETIDTETTRPTTHESTEAIRRESPRKPLKEIRIEESCYRGSSRQESLRAAARHGMVWSMILEKPKGARMLGRYHR